MLPKNFFQLKVICSLVLAIVFSCAYGQRPASGEIHQFLQAAIKNIKTADTNAFISMWRQPQYLELQRGVNSDSIASVERQRIYFRELCVVWSPYIDDLIFEIDCYDKHEKKKKIIDDEFGYEYTICVKSKKEPKKRKYVDFGLYFISKEGQLYCTSLLPSDLLLSSN